MLDMLGEAHSFSFRFHMFLMMF